MTQIIMKEESRPADVPALMCTTPTLSPKMPGNQARARVIDIEVTDKVAGRML
ncbi:hypothetical protein [Halomonas sp. HL-93]|uniref:hypothetical protein n=1 Tax=Halomonas sp. HL-93 TaxID=1666906 RepID=UPI0007F0F989|nr:hypothetical protein [Halomonas sp. HL-93]SBR52875.1 hypothetical protein GA0071314_3927 [Halomonas sp. HL-93]